MYSQKRGGRLPGFAVYFQIEKTLFQKGKIVLWDELSKLNGNNALFNIMNLFFINSLSYLYTIQTKKSLFGLVC